MKEGGNVTAIPSPKNSDKEFANNWMSQKGSGPVSSDYAEHPMLL